MSSPATLLLRDLSANGKLRVTGPDRVRFLNGLFTNDVVALAPGRGCHAALLTVKGRVVADAVLFSDEDALWVDVVPGLTAKVLGTLERHAIVDDVAFEDRTAELDEVGIYGAPARAALERALGVAPPSAPWDHLRAGDLRVAAASDLGLPGFRVIGARGVARAFAEKLTGDGARWLTDEEAEVHRVEGGVPRYGIDVSEDHFPLEARLDDAVSLTKGCYMGQEPIARLTARGHLNRKLCGLRLDGDEPAPRGARLSAPGRDDAGEVTSSVRSPRLGALALAYVHRSAWEPGTVLTVQESAGPRRATVAELPFRS